MAPSDVGLQTKIGRTSNRGSAALPEDSPAPIVDEGEEEAPTFRILPRAGGTTLWQAQRFPFHAPFLLYQHLQAGPKLSPCRLRDKGLRNRRLGRPRDRRPHDGEGIRSQERKLGRPRTKRSRNIQPNELRIGMQGALHQLPLHLLVFRTEIGPST